MKRNHFSKKYVGKLLKMYNLLYLRLKSFTFSSTPTRGYMLTCVLMTCKTERNGEICFLCQRCQPMADIYSKQ